MVGRAVRFAGTALRESERDDIQDWKGESPPAIAVYRRRPWPPNSSDDLNLWILQRRRHSRAHKALRMPLLMPSSDRA